MKKILALLLALVMALGCVGAVAEETASENTITLPSFTVAFESTLNVDAVTALLPMFGIDEATLAQVQPILALLADTNGQLVFADNGVQFDLGLKGQNILTIAGEQTESGFALASDILPSYVLTLANETIEGIMQQFTVQTEEAMAGVDMEALAEKLTGYFMEFAAAVSGAVKPGEQPEMGEFTFEFEDGDMTFNCRVPIEIDMEAIKTASLALMEQIKNDENVASLLSALGTMGIPVETTENADINLPEVTVYAYTNLDEEGNSDGTTLVTVEAAAEDQTVNVAVLLAGQNVAVFVEIPEQGKVNVYVETSETGAVIVSIEMNAAGVQCAEVIEVSAGENGLVLESETYFMDMENPITTDVVTLAMGGERDFTVLDENKAEIAVEQLMADTEGEIAGALLGDVMSNGLGALLAKVSEIMPDEVAALMTLLSGGQAAE